MWRLKFIFLYSMLVINIENIKATNADEYIIRTKSLPADLNFMPTLGNGHLGYTVFGDAIYMNGIYNGAGGNSRRARIPNWLNLSVSIVDNKSLNESSVQQHFEMQLHDGYFRWQQRWPTLGLKIEQRTYAHRFYNRALIYELLVQRTETKEPLILKLTQSPGTPSDAFNFTPLNIGGVNETSSTWKTLVGVTKTVEHELFQKELRTIFIYFSEDLKNGKLFKMAAGDQELYYSFVLTADEFNEKAQYEMKTVLDLHPSEILETHSLEWRNFWQTFNIRIDDNMELSHVINAGIFYLASSLPSQNSSQRNNLFYGLSPTGLGRGEKDSDYEGHNFWDTEIWMLPVVTQFSRNWTQELLYYRKNVLNAAKFNANATGYKGARFPWESAYTGTEVTNPCCPEVAEFQIHISTDIVLAAKHLLSVSNNTKWLCENDFPIILEIAKFLTSRTTYNTTTKKYHVKDVMGPDEDYFNITDSIYTNLGFKLALEFASYAYKICTEEVSGPYHWQDIADNINLLYDPVHDYHPEFEGYTLGKVVKQADVILLGYPLNYKMNDSTRLNDLKNYESSTRESGPAMTWSMFAINYLDINETKKANHYFEKGYNNYVRREFKVWSEVTLEHNGAANFLTGIGGFLQSIINGYAGIRFDHKNGKSIMEIRKAHVIPNTNGFQIHGLSLANARFDLSVNSTGSTNLICRSIGEKHLQLLIGNKLYVIQKGFAIDLKNGPIIIQTA